MLGAEYRFTPGSRFRSQTSSRLFILAETAARCEPLRSSGPPLPLGSPVRLLIPCMRPQPRSELPKWNGVCREYVRLQAGVKTSRIKPASPRGPCVPAGCLSRGRSGCVQNGESFSLFHPTQRSRFPHPDRSVFEMRVPCHGSLFKPREYRGAQSSPPLGQAWRIRRRSI